MGQTSINNINPRGGYEKKSLALDNSMPGFIFCNKFFLKFRLENLGELDNPEKGVGRGAVNKKGYDYFRIRVPASFISHHNLNPNIFCSWMR
jgi:hypothetical protein